MLRNPVVLLVEDDDKQARRISDELARRALPRPYRVASGEQAVLWAAANACDVCIVDYSLPDIDGLETLVRIHQRKPDLPIIMTSDARNERVAVAAFHASAADYVPKSSEMPSLVADLVERYAGAPDPAQVVSLAPALPQDVPQELGAPTYQNRLRVIGRQMDLYRYSAITILEAAGGFIVRCLAPGERTPQVLEFPDRDFPQLVANGVNARGDGERGQSACPLLPTGYEDFLRAVGHVLDQGKAQAITVSELDHFFAVAGVVPNMTGAGHMTKEPMTKILRDEEIAMVLDKAYARRVPTKSRFARLLGAG